MTSVDIFNYIVGHDNFKEDCPYPHGQCFCRLDENQKPLITINQSRVPSASVPFFNCDLKESSKIFLELFPNLCAKDATELIVMKKDLKRSAYWGIVEILHDTTYKEIERILEDHYEVLGVYLDSKEYSKATYIYRQVVERYETVPGLSKNFESDGYLNVYSTGVLDVTGGRTGFLLYEHKLYVANNPRYIDFLKSLVDKNSQCELLPGTEIKEAELGKLRFFGNINDFCVYRPRNQPDRSACIVLRPTARSLLRGREKQFHSLTFTTDKQRHIWHFAMRLAKYGKQLRENYRAFRNKQDSAINQKDYNTLSVPNPGPSNMAEAQRPEPSRVVPQDPPVAKLIDLDDSDDSPPTGAVGGAVPRLNPDDKRGKKPSRRPKSDGSEPDPDGGGEIIRESSADKKVEDCRAHLCMMDFREHDDYMEYTPRNIHRRSRSGRNYRRRHIPTPERRSKSEPKFMGSLIAACEKLIHGLWDTATGKYVTVVRDIPEDMAEMSFEGGVGKIEPTRQIKVKVLRKHLQGPTPKKSKTEFKLLKIPRFISKIGGTTRNRDEEERQNAHLDSQPGPSQRLRTEEEESTIDFEQPEPTTATETTPLTGKGKGKSPKGFGAVGKFAHSIGKFVKKSGSKTKSPDPKSSVSPQQHSVILERPSTSQETAQSIRIPLHSPTPHRPEQSTQVASSPPTGQTLEPSSRTALSPQPSQSVEQSIRPSLSPSTSQSVQRSTAQPASHPDYANIAPRSRQSHPDYVNIAPRSQQSHPDYVNITPGSSSQRKSKPEEETRPASGR